MQSSTKIYEIYLARMLLEIPWYEIFKHIFLYEDSKNMQLAITTGLHGTYKDVGQALVHAKCLEQRE